MSQGWRFIACDYSTSIWTAHWLPFQPEGEVLVKQHIPSVRIERVEKYDARCNLLWTESNPTYAPPEQYANVRGFMYTPWQKKYALLADFGDLLNPAKGTPATTSSSGWRRRCASSAAGAST